MRYPMTALFAILAVMGLLALTFCTKTHAADPTQDRGAWFKSLKQPVTGGSCCDLSDCRRTEAEWKAGGWQAQLPNGNWTAVPNDKVLDKRSIDGDAYLCSAPSGSIYCFVKPTMGF